MSILLAILALSFLIIIHELGHFTVAKLCDIKVLEFSLFMGPKLFSIQRGDTMYSIRLIPLGGYVRMEGEEAESDDTRAFNKKSVGARAAVIAAGPIMNLLVAIIILVIVISYTGFTTTTISEVQNGSPASISGIQKGDVIVGYDNKKVYHPNDAALFLYGSKGKEADIELIREGKPVKLKFIPLKVQAQDKYIIGFIPKQSEGANSNLVESVDPKAPAGVAGIKPNDRVIMLNDKKVTEIKEINEYMKINKEKTVKVTVQRGDSTQSFNVKPKLIKIQEQYDAGFAFTEGHGSFLTNVKQSMIYTYSTTRSVYYSIVYLISGNVSLKQMSGPVGIVSYMGDAVEQSTSVSMAILSLLNFTAFISINLGIFNLIPFPALDGSKLVILAVEAVRRKALPPEKEASITMVGFVFLMMLMVFTLYNDIVRIVSGG